MCLEMLSKVVGTAEEFAASLDGALVWALLRVGAVVTLEMLHTLEALAAVADVELVSRTDNERWRAGVASAATRSGACDGARDASASAVEHRGERAVVDGRTKRDHAVASMTRHLRCAVVRIEARRHEVVGGRQGIHEAGPSTITRCN